MVFVRAKSGPPNVGDPASMFTVQYFDEQGNMIIRSVVNGLGDAIILEHFLKALIA